MIKKKKTQMNNSDIGDLTVGNLPELQWTAGFVSKQKSNVLKANTAKFDVGISVSTPLILRGNGILRQQIFQFSCQCLDISKKKLTDDKNQPFLSR